MKLEEQQRTPAVVHAGCKSASACVVITKDDVRPVCAPRPLFSPSFEIVESVETFRPESSGIRKNTSAAVVREKTTYPSGKCCIMSCTMIEARSDEKDKCGDRT